MNYLGHLENQFISFNERLSKNYIHNLPSIISKSEDNFTKDEIANLAKAGLDADFILTSHEKQDKESLNLIKRVREDLITRSKPQLNQNYESHYSSYLANYTTVVPVFGYSSLALDNKGNPDSFRILPTNGGKFKLEKSIDGIGSGCAGDSIKYNTFNVFFQFVPHTTGSWYFVPMFDMHGFYIANANDSFFSCKYSATQMKVSVTLEQYFVRNYKEIMLLNREGSNIILSGFFDTTRGFGIGASPLKENDPVWICVTFEIKVSARGSGSYAEINFSEGNQHFIDPLFAYAYFTG